MKILKFVNQEFQAEKIIKDGDNIIGQDINGIEVFAFRGISDFNNFSLEEGQTFDIAEQNLEEQIKLMRETMNELILGGM